jgi:ribokinase
MILVAGSANLDFVVRAPHIPAPGEAVLGHDFKPILAARVPTRR